MEEHIKKRPFPLKINLQDFFSDHRQKAYICVKGNWTSILDLQNHIINLFSLSHEVFLTDSDGYLFPAEESIDIIQHGGSALKVNRRDEPLRTGFDHLKPFKKSTRNSTPFTNGGHPEDVMEITETPIVGILPPKENGAVLPEVREEKKRRKRVRRRKKNNDECQEDSSSLQEESTESRKKLKGSKSNSHIRFATSADGDEEDEDVVDNLQITDTPLGQSDVIVSRTLHKIPGVESKADKSPNKSNVTNSFALEELRERLPGLNLPLLKKLPRKDDVIAFKVLKMGETYEPILSEFVIGIVESVRKEKNELDLLILSGETELKQPEGKFSLPETPSDNCDDLPDDDLFTVEFSNLREVRRLDLAKLGTTM